MKKFLIITGISLLAILVLSVIIYWGFGFTYAISAYLILSALWMLMRGMVFHAEMEKLGQRSPIPKFSFSMRIPSSLSNALSQEGQDLVRCFNRITDIWFAATLGIFAGLLLFSD